MKGTTTGTGTDGFYALSVPPESVLVFSSVGFSSIEVDASDAGDIQMLRLRGISSLSGNNQPLFIVDGVSVSNIQLTNGPSVASGANTN